MKLRVKLFAAAKELARRDEIVVELPPGATVGDLRRAVVKDCPALERIVASALWAVDTEFASADVPLTEQAEVALIPPVSGG
jgi:molybdopterin converting factor subunit 1